jgi:nucleoside transporter
MTTSDASVESAPVPFTQPTPRADTGLMIRLSVMMFLQYAIWGAWLPLMFPFFNEYRGIGAGVIGTIAAVGAAGALVAPFLAGQLADRYMNTEKFLGISHLVGAALVWSMAAVTDVKALMVLSFFYALLYTPTLALTNSLAFYHLPDRDRDFGKVRVWGTIGWIAVGIGIGQYLLYQAGTVRAEQVRGMGDAFRLSAILGVILGLYCFFLPKTPPRREAKKFAPGEALGEVARNRALFWLFLISFPIACIHQFYFVRTAGFLGSDALGLNNAAATINRIFGVGGGGLMTIGQMSEIIVLAIMPFVAKRLPRKTLLSIGLVAYVLRFFVFAYLPHPAAVVAALTLHGVCFGCFFFVAFMIVDEQTTPDVRASAQNLYNLIIVGLGVIVGNLFAGWVDTWAAGPEGISWRTFFSIPMWIAVACLVLLLVAYPKKSRVVEPEALAVA